MLSLTCPLCLSDLTDRVLRWVPRPIPESEKGSRVCHCRCYGFEVILNEPVVGTRPAGLYACFRARGHRSQVWVDLIDGTAWAPEWDPNVLRFHGPVSGSERLLAWEELWRAATVDLVMSS